MPTELVMLSDRPPTIEQQARAAAALHPGGSYVLYRGDEIGQFVDADGAALLTVFATKPILQQAEARASLRHAPTSFALWTEMTVPFGDATEGRRLAEAIAEPVDGVIEERA